MATLKVFVINIQPRNWETCRERSIFGLRKGTFHPHFERGDLFLVRVTGKEYGVRAIWVFEKENPVKDPSEVPWDDAEYDHILQFRSLEEFAVPFSEEFQGPSKWSEKIGMNSIRFPRSVFQLSPSETKRYLCSIEGEKGKELEEVVDYLGQNISLRSLFSRVVEEAGKEAKVTEPKRVVSTERLDLVGGPINFRDIVYAPLNEAGVILLFSRVMSDLGIVYESSPTAFPDMIGRIRTERGFEKRRIEFEYRSSSFKQHGHDPNNCDLIVCWEHDWKECPIEVIELREVVRQLQE